MFALRFGSGLGILAVVLGCSGLPLDGLPLGGSAPAEGDKVLNLKVGTSSLLKGPNKPRPAMDALMAKAATGEFIVKLKSGAKMASADAAGMPSVLKGFGAAKATAVHGLGAKDGALSSSLGLDRTVRFGVEGKSMDEVLSTLSREDEVEWVEPVIRMHAAGVPNDPYYSFQWHLSNLHMDEAWAVTKGQGVVVAVVDTGVSTHEDGLLHLLPGHDFVDGDDDASDENGHGTHVAGTIAQATDNGIGVAGIAPEASILPVRVLGADGSGTNDGVAAGIIWAVDQGAQIINLSLGAPVNSQVVADAISYAYQRGVTVCAATGNDGYTDGVGYPAALDTPIAVGAVDFKNVVSFYSNQGSQIDIVAPGGDTTADQNGDGYPDGVVQETFENGTWSYMFFQGTSMATPHVSGVAALLVASGVTGPDAVKERLVSTAKDLGTPGQDDVYGAGLVDPVAALRGAAVARAGSDGGSTTASVGGGASEAAGVAKIEIGEPTIARNGPQKVTISWTTSVACPTMIRGPGGFKHKDDALTKSHKVVVPAAQGGAPEKFEIGAMAGGLKASRTVTVTK